MTVKYVCKTCGCNVGLWHHGWKHQRGWRTKKQACDKPVPVEVKQPSKG